MEVKTPGELTTRECRALCGIYLAGCGVVVTYDDACDVVRSSTQSSDSRASL